MTPTKGLRPLDPRQGALPLDPRGNFAPSNDLPWRRPWLLISFDLKPWVWNTLNINFSTLTIYRNLYYLQKYSFGDILRKFDETEHL